MFEIRPFKHGSGPYSTRHRHPEGQLFVLSEGFCIFTTENGMWMMTPGRPCWIPPHQLHNTETLGPVAGTSLFLDEILCGTLPRFSFVMRAAPILLAVVDRLASLSPDNPRARHLVPVLIDEIAVSEPELLHLPAPHDPILQRMVSDLFAAPQNERSLDDWASLLGISNRTLVRRFKDETGVTFIDWRRRARVMKAISLLCEGQDVNSIAAAVGYESASAFAASFRAVTGSSPRRFALEHRIGQRVA